MPPARTDTGPDTRKVLTFRVGAARLAAPAEAVAEVFRRPKVTRVPHAPASLAGVARLRGAVVPVVSMARLLGQEETAPDAAARVLLLELDEPVGVAVDAVGALTEMPAAGVEEGQGGRGRLYLQGEEAVRVVDLLELLRRDFQSLGGRAGREARATAAPGPMTQPAAEPEAGVAALTLLTFDLAGQLYAFGLDEVVEVLAAPSQIDALPRTDAAMVGVMPLREGLLPVVSLRALLGLPAGDGAAGRRIVVARVGDARIGLLVDRLRAILRTPAARVEPVPAVLNRGQGEARIRSICRLPDGRGLVSILSAERIFSDATLAHILADGRQKGAEMSADTARGTREQIVVFQVGQEEYGLPVDAVDEVVRLPEVLTRVPKAPAFVLGVMNLRGKVLPVVDQRSRLEVAGASGGVRRRVIVTTIEGRQAGFAVDGVSQILSVPAEHIAATSDLAADGGILFDRIANLEIDGRIILLVNPREMLSRAERDLLKAFDDLDAASVGT